jgi:hypothetical protein
MTIHLDVVVVRASPTLPVPGWLAHHPTKQRCEARRLFV